MTSAGTPRRAIAVGLLVAADGRILLQLRDDDPSIINPGRWGFFGGHVEAGETPEQAFLREMREELGWRPRHFEPYATREVDRDGWHVTSHVFAAHLDADSGALTLGEGQAMALFAPDALPANATPGARDVIAEFARTPAYDRVRERWDRITTAGLLVDARGRFLLQLRDDRPDIANPGLWGSFGGAVEPYESPHEGFLRELQEELGWQPRDFTLHLAAPRDAPWGRELIYVLAARVDVPPDSLVLGEGQALGFFAPDALPPDTVPALASLIRRYARTPEYRALSVGA